MKYSPLLLLLVFYSCIKKNTLSPCAGTIPAILQFANPAAEPVWHPSGQIIGFNYAPLLGFFPNGTPPCVWYMSSVNTDSSGFYLINRNSTGFKRITSYYLQTPSWSPDGKWLAFSLGSQICKMPFDGENFDTTQITQLTTAGKSFSPCWTEDSDSIYFDLNIAAPTGTGFYSIWKMASDGSGKQMISRTTSRGDEREPFIGKDNKIYYAGYAGKEPEIFSMNKDGSSPIQVTYGGKNGYRHFPKIYHDTLFFLDGGGITSTPTNQYKPRLITVSFNYDISSKGEIIFSNEMFKVPDNRWGTLWITKRDGSESFQLTFNHY